MNINEDLIRNVVSQVLAEVKRSGGNINGHVSGKSSFAGRFGIFTNVDEACRAAREAFEQLSERTMEERRRIIGHIRRISIENCVELGTMEMNETKIGRLVHKIEKLKTLGEKTPGVEFMKSEVFSGDHGLAVIEHAPFGVIGAITPVTHSLPTITGNAVSMLASGNTVVVNPHPSGKKVAAEGVRRFNRAIYQDLGIDNLICVIADRMLEAMERAGAVRLTASEVETLTKNAIVQVGEGEHKHDAPAKDFLGQDAAVLAKGAGKSGVSDKVELLFGETDLDNPFVPVEQMMPFVPFVRCRSVNEAIDRAKEAEHGFRHTSLIHSNNVKNMTRMGRIMATTLFVKNGPCMASLGLGGEGYLSF